MTYSHFCLWRLGRLCRNCAIGVERPDCPLLEVGRQVRIALHHLEALVPRQVHDLVQRNALLCET